MKRESPFLLNSELLRLCKFLAFLLFDCTFCLLISEFQLFLKVQCVTLHHCSKIPEALTKRKDLSQSHIEGSLQFEIEDPHSSSHLIRVSYVLRKAAEKIVYLEKQRTGGCDQNSTVSCENTHPTDLRTSHQAPRTCQHLPVVPCKTWSLVAFSNQTVVPNTETDFFKCCSLIFKAFLWLPHCHYKFTSSNRACLFWLMYSLLSFL